MRNKRLFDTIACGLFALASMVFTSVAFSQTTFVKKEALLQTIGSEAKRRGNDRIFAKIQSESEGGQEDNSFATTAFSRSYVKNFNGSFQEIVVSNKQSFFASFEGIEEEVSVANGVSYSNQKGLVRFECLDINLYVKREREQEISFYGFDGFAYIPDVVADRLIEESDRFSSYDDIIEYFNTDASKSSPFIVSTDDGIQRNYRIANIFHINGFKDDFSSSHRIYNDRNFGLSLSEYLGPFLITSDSVVFQRYGSSLLFLSDSKKYSLDQYLELFSSFAKPGYRICGTVDIVANGHKETLVGSSELIDLYGRSFSLTPSFASFLGFALASLLFVGWKVWEYRRVFDRCMHLVLAAASLTPLVISQVLCLFPSPPPPLLLFFSVPTNACAILVLTMASIPAICKLIPRRRLSR